MGPPAQPSSPRSPQASSQVSSQASPQVSSPASPPASPQVSHEALVGSRWNLALAVDGGWVVVNSLTMRAAKVDAELAAALTGGAPVPADAALAPLQRLGLVATAEDDERRGVAALTARGWAQPVLDLFALGPVSTLGRPAARQAAQIIDSITRAQEAHAIATVKLRLCGATGSLARRNAEVLTLVRAACRARGLQLISLLMADELQDALACAAPDASAGSAGGERANEAMFDAFFFRWRLGGPERDAAALDAVRGLISRGKLVALQLAVRDLAALRAQQDWLRALATDRTLMRSPNVAWDVGLEDAARPFFVASVCHRDPASVDALAEARELLTALGLPLRPALAPFQFHQGCPLLLPQAHILLPSGQRLLCNDDVGSGDAGFAPRQASEARCAQQLEAACARCAALPFCLSRCPKLPAPTPGDAECERVKTRARAELVRLVACGQLPAEPLEPLEPRRSAS